MSIVYVLLTGVAVAAAFRFLITAISGHAPAFDRETVDRLGVFGAFAAFCFSGPALVIREFDRRDDGDAPMPVWATVLATLVALVWSGSLGVLAVETSRALLS